VFNQKGIAEAHSGVVPDFDDTLSRSRYVEVVSLPNTRWLILPS
jgi:hypothetical protein